MKCLHRELKKIDALLQSVSQSQHCFVVTREIIAVLPARPSNANEERQALCSTLEELTCRFFGLAFNAA
jgi:hypothetical protein